MTKQKEVIINEIKDLIIKKCSNLSLQQLVKVKNQIKGKSTKKFTLKERLKNLFAKKKVIK